MVSKPSLLDLMKAECDDDQEDYLQSTVDYLQNVLIYETEEEMEAEAVLTATAFEAKEEEEECTDEAAKKRCLKKNEQFSVRILEGAKSFKCFYVLLETEEDLSLKVDQLISRTLTFGLNCYAPWEVASPLCLVQHTRNTNWYRAKVKHTDSDQNVHLMLIDTGEELKAPLKELREMHSALKSIPALAHRCTLPIMPVASETERRTWNEDVIRRFYKLNRLGTGLVCWVLDTNSDNSTIDLKLLDEHTTWCSALEDVGEAVITDTIGPHDVERTIYEEVSGDRHLKLLGKTEELKDNDQYLQSSNDSVALKKTLVNTSPFIPKRIPADLSEFSYERVPKLRPIHEMKDKIFQFNSLIGFNILTLIERDDGIPKFEELCRVTDSWIADDRNDDSSSFIPKLQDVVLAPWSKGNYRRAKVEDIKGGGSVVFVRFVDFGTLVMIPKEQLKRPSRQIMETPELVYIVKVDQVPDDIPILSWQFKELRNYLNKVVVMGAEKQSLKKDAKLFPTVVLYIDEEERTHRFSTVLNNLVIWRWYKLYRAMYTDFEELQSKYNWSLYSIERFAVGHPITEVLKKSTIEISIIYARVINQRLFIAGVPLDTNLRYQERTLQAQMTFFLEKVHGENMSRREVHGYEHLMAVSLDEERLKQQIKRRWSCHWHRCFNHGESGLFCVDCLWSAEPDDEGCFPGLTIRPLPPDFYQACPLSLICRVDAATWSKNPAAKRAVEENFPPGKTVSVKLLSKTPVYEKGCWSYTAELVGMDKMIESLEKI